MTERRPADSHAHPFLSTEFEEPTAKLPLWRPYAPAAGATFETLAVVEARGLEFLRIDFEASSCPKFPNPAHIPSFSGSGGESASLDINAMQEAAKKLEGLHDFRNLCKVDPSKQISNFDRRIFHASINAASNLLETKINFDISWLRIYWQ